MSTTQTVVTAIVFVSYLAWLVAFDWIEQRRQRGLDAHIDEALDVANDQDLP